MTAVSSYMPTDDFDQRAAPMADALRHNPKHHSPNFSCCERTRRWSLCVRCRRPSVMFTAVFVYMCVRVRHLDDVSPSMRALVSPHTTHTHTHNYALPCNSNLCGEGAPASANGGATDAVDRTNSGGDAEVGWTAEDEEKLHCLCRLPADTARFRTLMTCDLCHSWFHPACVRLKVGLGLLLFRFFGCAHPR